MTRPTKLTPAVHQKIVSAIRTGNHLEQSAAYGGVTYQTFRNWMDRGELARSGPFFEFFEAVTLAQVEAEVSAVATIRQAGLKDWRATLAFLERRFPTRWGRKAAEEVSAPTVLIRSYVGVDVDNID